MSSIHIERSHSLTQKQAHAMADELARDLARRFGVAYHWQGDTLHFDGRGVRGTLALPEGVLRLHMTLGLLVRPFKAKIEQSVHRHLDDTLGPA